MSRLSRKVQILKWIGATACLLTVLVWALSYFYFIDCVVPISIYPSSSPGFHGIHAYFGKGCASIHAPAYLGIHQTGIRLIPLRKLQLFSSREFRWRFLLPAVNISGRPLFIYLPMWLVAGAILLLTGFVWWHYRKLPAGYCQECGGKTIDCADELCSACLRKKMRQRVWANRKCLPRSACLGCACAAFFAVLYILLSGFESFIDITAVSRLLRSSEELVIGLLFLLAFVGAYLVGRFIYFLSRWHRIYIDHLACRTCGYNLTGNVSGVCPECGEKIDKGIVAGA